MKKNEQGKINLFDLVKITYIVAGLFFVVDSCACCFNHDPENAPYKITKTEKGAIETMKTVKKGDVLRHCKDNNYDGYYNDDHECGCLLHNLVPCGKLLKGCNPVRWVAREDCTQPCQNICENGCFQEVDGHTVGSKKDQK